MSKGMVKARKQGNICFVSSTRPCLHTLRFELQLYNVDVKIFFPSTMLTPGYEEKKAEPKITLKLKGDSGLPSDPPNPCSRVRGFRVFPIIIESNTDVA